MIMEQVKEFLNEVSSDGRWIGRRVPIVWPANRAPDLILWIFLYRFIDVEINPIISKIYSLEFRPNQTIEINRFSPIILQSVLQGTI